MESLMRAKKKTDGTSTMNVICDTMYSLRNWSKLVNVMKKITSTNTVEDDDYVYFKVYYEGNFTLEDRNETFASVSSLPLNKNHIFLGVKEYMDNSEMCFVFKKKK